MRGGPHQAPIRGSTEGPCTLGAESASRRTRLRVGSRRTPASQCVETFKARLERCKSFCPRPKGERHERRSRFPIESEGAWRYRLRVVVVAGSAYPDPDSYRSVAGLRLMWGRALHELSMPVTERT